MLEMLLLLAGRVIAHGHWATLLSALIWLLVRTRLTLLLTLLLLLLVWLWLLLRLLLLLKSSLLILLRLLRRPSWHRGRGRSLW